MTSSAFDDLTDVYEAMIDWPKRLAHEGPFFRRLFEQCNVNRLADVACGTGRHAAMFHSWGLNVRGSDISPRMIQRAREQFGEPEGLRWAIQSFEQPPGPPGSFDAVVCIGNSLALALDMTSVASALRRMLDAVRSGGLVVVHVLNLWKLPPGPCVWQKIIAGPAASGQSLILKGVHRCDDKGYVELVVTSPGADDASIRSESVPFLGLKAEALEAIARDGAASAVMFFGTHQRQAYDATSSPDLIMVAQKHQ